MLKWLLYNEKKGQSWSWTSPEIIGGSMKKGIIVLLIAVLVAGFAFADGKLTAGTLKGDATIKFGIDLDDKTFGFANSTTAKYNFTFEFDSTKVAVGEDHQTELWAELAAEASASVSIKDSAAIAHKQEVKITKANIHVGEWTFGILNMGTGPDYAKAYYKVDDVVFDVLKGPDKYVPGFTVSYKDYNAGFGITGHWTDKEVHLKTAGWLETKAFKFGENEEFSAQAGAYALYFRDPLLLGGRKYAGVALKGGYAAEKLTANVATDMQIIRHGGENTFAYEASADATYTINDNGKAGVNVYSVYDKAAIEPAVYSKGVKLDAKAWANYNFDFDGTKLETTAYVDVRDILTDERTFEVKATEKLTLDKVVLEFSETWGYFSTKIFDPYTLSAYAFTLTAKATYTAEKFEAFASIDSLTFGKFAIGSDSVSVLMLEASCGIKSTKVIENAEIGATYKGFGFFKMFDNENAESITKKGAIEAYAKIAF